MPRPSEQTPEQRRAEAESLRERRREVDRQDAPLFFQQLLDDDEGPEQAISDYFYVYAIMGFAIGELGLEKLLDDYLSRG